MEAPARRCSDGPDRETARRRMRAARPDGLGEAGEVFPGGRARGRVVRDAKGVVVRLHGRRPAGTGDGACGARARNGAPKRRRAAARRFPRRAHRVRRGHAAAPTSRFSRTDTSVRKTRPGRLRARASSWNAEARLFAARGRAERSARAASGADQARATLQLQLKTTIRRSRFAFRALAVSPMSFFILTETNAARRADERRSAPDGYARRGWRETRTSRAHTRVVSCC